MPDPKALLVVFSEPGVVPLAEYHDWYDNEHIPLRLEVPTFSSWARWEQIDGSKPSWAASYDLGSVEDTKVPPYSRLAETRSEREKALMAKLDVVDRRIYELHTPKISTPPSPLFDPKKAAKYTVTVSVDIKPEAEEDFHRWYEEEHIPMLAKVPGWVRTRRYVLWDELCIGQDGGLVRTEPPPKYLAIHEWATQEKLESEVYKRSMNTPWRKEVYKSVVRKERREFELHKQWTQED